MSKSTGMPLYVPLIIGVVLIAIIWVSFSVVRSMDIVNLTSLLGLADSRLFQVLGIVLIVVFLPIYLMGVVNLGIRRIVGRPASLQVTGVYRYVRNPVYSGITFVLYGIGFELNSTALTIVSVVWTFITVFFSKKEAAELEEWFGGEYVQYRNSTPLFVPNFALMLSDLARRDKRD